MGVAGCARGRVWRFGGVAAGGADSSTGMGVCGPLAVTCGFLFWQNVCDGPRRSCHPCRFAYRGSGIGSGGEWLDSRSSSAQGLVEEEHSSACRHCRPGRCSGSRRHRHRPWSPEGKLGPVERFRQETSVWRPPGVSARRCSASGLYIDPVWCVRVVSEPLHGEVQSDRACSRVG